MALVILLIGAIVVVAAIRNSHEALFTALGQDVPQFIVWAAAIVALGVIGFIPGLKPVSRGLLALVFVVLILQNYQQVIAGFQNAWQNPGPVGKAAAEGSSGGSSGGGSGQGSSVLGGASTYSQLFSGGDMFGGFGSGAADSGAAAGAATDASAAAAVA